MNIVVFCGSCMGRGPAFAREARRLGAWIAGQGHALVYGGSSTGLMGEVASAVLEAGGRVVGVEASVFVNRGVANRDVTEMVVVGTLAERKREMMRRGDAFVALPGGVGTLDEVTEVACGKRVGDPDCVGKPCVMLSVDGFWDGLRLQMRRVAQDGFLSAGNPGAAPGSSEGLVAFAADVDELAEILG